MFDFLPLSQSLVSFFLSPFLSFSFSFIFLVNIGIFYGFSTELVLWMNSTSCKPCASDNIKSTRTTLDNKLKSSANCPSYAGSQSLMTSQSTQTHPTNINHRVGYFYKPPCWIFFLYSALTRWVNSKVRSSLVILQCFVFVIHACNLVSTKLSK